MGIWRNSSGERRGAEEGKEGKEGGRKERTVKGGGRKQERWAEKKVREVKAWRSGKGKEGNK